MGSLGVLAVLGLGALLFMSKEAKGKQKSIFKNEGCLDANMPLDFKIEADKLLSNPDLTPQGLQNITATANLAEQQGYTKLAACLRAIVAKHS